MTNTEIAELLEELAEAREIVTPNGACPKCDDPECGKVKCQDCSKLMHPDDEMVGGGPTVGPGRPTAAFLSDRMDARAAGAHPTA